MTVNKPNSLSILVENLENVIERMGADDSASVWVQLLTREDRRKLAEKLALEAVEVVLGRVSMKLASLEDENDARAFERHLDANEVMERILKEWET